MTQSSSVLLPFDSFMTIDRSYATCYRSEKVRNKIQNAYKEAYNLRDEIFSATDFLNM